MERKKNPQLTLSALNKAGRATFTHGHGCDHAAYPSSAGRRPRIPEQAGSDDSTAIVRLLIWEQKLGIVLSKHPPVRVTWLPTAICVKQKRPNYRSLWLRLQQ